MELHVIWFLDWFVSILVFLCFFVLFLYFVMTYFYSLIVRKCQTNKKNWDILEWPDILMFAREKAKTSWLVVVATLFVGKGSSFQVHVSSTSIAAHISPNIIAPNGLLGGHSFLSLLLLYPYHTAMDIWKR